MTSEQPHFIPVLIKNTRKKLGLTQLEFAKKFNLHSHATVFYWENGKSNVPNTVIEFCLMFISCVSCKGTGICPECGGEKFTIKESL